LFFLHHVVLNWTNEQDTSNHHETHLNQNATENHVKEESKEVSTEEESIEDRKTFDVSCSFIGFWSYSLDLSWIGISL
jgi:hypothetical protein